MRLLSLSVENIGPFSDLTTFDLSTSVASSDPPRNLVLFRGHNGAGKSTLFQSFRLALHGMLALGDRVGQQKYNQYLRGLLHRHTENGKTVTAKEGGVALTFEYVQSGVPLHLRVERRWIRNGAVVIENLSVTKNGAPLDVDTKDYQAWLNDLIPPGLAALCFFDAEHLDTLASTDRNASMLGEVLRRLLGIDLVERLQSDLEFYLGRRGGAGKTHELREAAVACQAEVDKWGDMLAQLQADKDVLALEEADAASELARQEQRLAAEGGSYAARRAGWQERLNVVQQDIEGTEHRLRDLCAHLLPFALAPNLCRQVAEEHYADDYRRRYLWRRCQPSACRSGQSCISTGRLIC